MSLYLNSHINNFVCVLILRDLDVCGLVPLGVLILGNLNVLGLLVDLLLDDGFRFSLCDLLDDPERLHFDSFTEFDNSR